MIEGSFRDVSLPALLQLLCFETNKSFRIRVTDENQKGYILVRKGWVIAAKFGILEGEDAICEFLSWDEGNFLAEQVVAQTDVEKNLRFDFQPNPGFIQDCMVLAEENIGLNSEITGSQFFGSPEWKTLVKEHPLDRECFSVLAWLREGRKMHQALREFGFDIVRATAILSMLIRTQSIQVIRPGADLGDRQIDQGRPEYHVVPTTGGQQEAAAALAKEAARALESATDVADEAFMSKSFKSADRQLSEQQQKTGIESDSQHQSFSVDYAVRSSMEARLRARKSPGFSGTNIPALKEKSESKTASKPAQTSVPAADHSQNDVAEPKRQRPDLFAVLQSRAGRVVPDLGDSKPISSANSAKATASTHDVIAHKQTDQRKNEAASSPVKKNGDVPTADQLIVRNEQSAPSAPAESPVASSAERAPRPAMPSSSPFSKLVTKIESERLNAAASAAAASAAVAVAAQNSGEPSPLSANWPKKKPSAESTSESISVGTQGILKDFPEPLLSPQKAAAEPDTSLQPDPGPPALVAPAALPAHSSVQSPPPVSDEPPEVPPVNQPALAPAPPLAVAADDPRVIAKTHAMPLVAFDIERLLLTTFIATQFGKLALGNPSLDPQRRQTLMDAEYGKSLATSIDDGTRLPAAVLSSYRYCLDRGYIETQDPVIPLTADLLLGRMEIDQYLLQRRRITGDELRDLIKIAREEGIKLTQLLVKSGYLTEADLETLGREQKRFAFK